MKQMIAQLPLLPPDRERIETVAVLRKEAKARQALAELKGFAPTIPNQNILINAIVLQEAKEKNEVFQKSYGALLNRFTKQFIELFCDTNGNIQWEKLVQFNSGKSIKAKS
jgi:hypothetical protein